MKNLGVGANVC